MIRVFNYFLECVKLLKISFHFNINRPVENASMTIHCIFDVFDMKQNKENEFILYIFI